MKEGPIIPAVNSRVGECREGVCTPPLGPAGSHPGLKAEVSLASVKFRNSIASPKREPATQQPKRSSSLDEFVATCTRGVEPILVQELESFGIQNPQEGKGVVSFRGSLEDAYRACLWSRLANRILLPLHTFPAPDPERLYHGVRAIRWDDHLTPQNTLAVDFTSTRSQITHTHYGALKVKDAIVDQFRATQGTRPSVDPLSPHLRIRVHLEQDQATVYLDLSGDSLHRRGYRLDGAQAPLKENLGAALLAFAGWKEQVEERGAETAFLDPMCGSGTLPIEAAWIAARIPPGCLRTQWGFSSWQGHVPAIWKRLLAEAQDLQVRDPKRLPRIVGYDANFRVIRPALECLEKTGLRGRVHIEKREFSQVEAIAEQGVFMVNPPYGERLGDVEELGPLYRSIGDTLKQKFSGWRGYIFTGSLELSKQIGLRPSRRIPLWNGPIECRLLSYELYLGSVNKK
jgi:23S rRNA (guanine2445-N2)-methyltransferase / 23S rRNA (guanine2069-N7)-methyltransferase